MTTTLEKFLRRAGTLALIGVAALVAITFIPTSGASEQQASVLASPDARPGVPRRVVNVSTTTAEPTAKSLGDSQARVVAIEFSDLQCSVSKRYAATVHPEIRRKYVDKGQLFYVFKHYPLGRPDSLGRAAAAAAECTAQQGRFWQLQQRLIAHDAALTADSLATDVAALDLNQRRYRTCLETEGPAVVDADKTEGTRLDVSSTPTLLLGRRESDGSVRVIRRLHGNLPWVVYEAAIEQLLNGGALVSGAVEPSYVTYDSFMKLPASARQERFSTLTPENKSALKREHAERWLKANQAQLSEGQVALVREGIAFLSAELYGKPNDAQLRKQEEALKHRLECSLGRERVMAAFTFLPPGQTQSWPEKVDEWLAWFSNC